MKTVHKILNYLDSIPGKKNKKVIYAFQDLLLPIFLVIEYICYNRIWNKIVIPELLTNDEIVSFFDKNEFGYIKNKLYKKDIIEENSLLDSFNPDEAEITIQNEFITALTSIIEKNTNIDIENYITLSTKIDLIKNDESRNLLKVYTIIIMYYRYPEILRKLRYLKYWCFIVLGISIIIYLTFS